MRHTNLMYAIRFWFAALMLAFLLIGCTLVFIGARQVRVDRVALNDRDQRLLTIICRHVISDEAYTAELTAIKLHDAQLNPKDQSVHAIARALQKHAEAVAAEAKLDCQVGIK